MANLNENISNSKRFPNNIFEPETINVDGSQYTKYLARFNNMYDLYEYLKSKPKINKAVFKILSSVHRDEVFAGKPYEEAVEDLIKDFDPGYEEFLSLQRNLNSGRNMRVHKFETVRTLAGGHLNVPLYSAGNPFCYETENRVIQPKFVRIHAVLSYNWATDKKQVFNRAIIITNVLKALEGAGYNVDLNTFELSSCGDEIVNIIVNVKKYGERLNMDSLYKSLCHVEFLRRILFRILETMNVKNNWQDGYGRTCSEDFVRKALNFDSRDIYFDQPRYLGIIGDDLAADFGRAISHLKLDDKIDVERAKEEFKESAKSLKLIKKY